MNDEFSLATVNMLKLQTITELQECNNYTAQFGLSLNKEQIHNLAKKRFQALKDARRIEFGSGILKKLIYEFCDSLYIVKDRYADIILELQDSFYYFKNESLDLIPDDELISFMKLHFDTTCEGSIDKLNSVSLEELCRDTRHSTKIIH